MDRCALFVDAGYVLADGAMAVHGTRRRESVSWDYQGLLQLLASLATERSGLPLLRCYWYEATVEGRRSADHDALADLPGVKLRLVKIRPGRREGVEGEIHRDLATLARNRAVSDAMVVSAEEDLAQVIADVQDLGLRVSLLHIAVDGNWTISRALRQECDDIAEISSEHLRPYVELISGAEPPHAEEREGAALIALHPAANGRGPAPAGRAPAYAPVQAGPDTVHQVPPSIYTAPVVAEYQRPAPQLSRVHPAEQVAARDESRSDPAAAPESPAPPAGADLQPAGQDVAMTPPDLAGAAPDPAPAAAAVYAALPDATAVQPDAVPARQDAAPAWTDHSPGWQDQSAAWGARPDQSPGWQDLAAGQREPQPVARQDFGPHADLPVRADVPVRPERGAGQELYAAPVAMPVLAEDQHDDLAATRPRPAADLSGYSPGAIREQLPREPLPGEAGDGRQQAPAGSGSAQIHRLPTRGAGLAPLAPHQAPGQAPGQHMPGQPTAAQSALSASTAAQPSIGQPVVPVMPPGPGAGYAPGRNGAYSGPQPVLPPLGQPAGPLIPPASDPLAPAGAAYSSALPGVSLAEAVQSAHDEGQEFGASVARDAPALWLEAVLARKPRMPSDLEARLLQGSALPIDYLLHDEVRHALRRGFWDAMERARR